MSNNIGSVMFLFYSYYHVNNSVAQVAGSSTPMLVLMSEIYRKEGIAALYSGLGKLQRFAAGRVAVWIQLFSSYYRIRRHGATIGFL